MFSIIVVVVVILFCCFVLYYDKEHLCWRGSDLTLTHVQTLSVNMYPSHHQQVPIDSLVLLSSLAKTELPADIAWKADNLLPILKGIATYYMTLATYSVKLNKPAL